MVTLALVGFVGLYTVIQLCYYYVAVWRYKRRGAAIAVKWLYVTAFDYLPVGFLLPWFVLMKTSYVAVGIVITYAIIAIKVWALQKLYEDEVGAIPLLDDAAVPEWLLKGNVSIRIKAALLWPAFELVRQIATYRKHIQREKRFY